jgi:N6-adenosine-specific RNA methylase IME4
MAQKRYRTILADPPWDIHQKGRLGAIQHYPLMTIDEIKALPVADLADDDAHLWLWTTNAALEEAYDVARAWGFTPRSLMTWFKPYMGLGNYLRNCTEQLIFATRGKAPILVKNQPNWLFAIRQEHSHKPEELYEIIERCSQGPYVELFARRKRPGWDSWGNEVASDVSFAGITKTAGTDKVTKRDHVAGTNKAAEQPGPS